MLAKLKYIFLNQFFKIYLFLVKILNLKYVYSLYGVFFKSNINDATFNFYVKALYGYDFSNYIKKLKKTNVFIDIGANQGLYSILACQNKKINRVYSFEPINYTYNFLKLNIKKNKSLEKCKIFNYGIGEFNKNVKFNFRKNHTGNSSMIIDQNLNKETTLIDGNIINFEKLNKLIEFDKYDNIGIKIDTEGAEVNILNTLKKCIFWENIKWIYIEVDGNKVQNKIIYNIMRKNNFVIKKKILPYINLNHKNSPYYDVIFEK